MSSSNPTERLFSGIQPTGAINIGTYLGALRQWVAMQDEYESFFCIVNLHALTLRQNPEEFKARTRELAALFLAAGLNPDKTHIFIQSHVPEHSELAWLLSTFTMMGELEKMTQFKDKSNRHKNNVNAGLFTYPILMAADILLYQTSVVPIGDDQKQHLELARNIAQRVNHHCGQELFKMPKPIFPQAGGRIKDLQHPDQKMSKSLPPAGTLPLLEEPKKLNKKIRRAVTDNEGVVRYDPESQPGVANLLTILAAIGGGKPEDKVAQFEGQGYKELKEAVSEAVLGLVEPIQERFAELMADPQRVDEILADGARAARQVAAGSLDRFRDALGLLPSRL